MTTHHEDGEAKLVEYPKWVSPKNGGERVIVHSRQEEDDVTRGHPTPPPKLAPLPSSGVNQGSLPKSPGGTPIGGVGVGTIGSGTGPGKRPDLPPHTQQKESQSK